MTGTNSPVQADVLHLTLNQLGAFSLQALKDSGTLERAAKSKLYRKKWKEAGIVAEEIRTYEDFAKIPFTASREVQRAIDEGPIEDVLCSNEVAHWFCTTGTTGMPKWVPYSRKDIDLFMEIRDRNYKLASSIEGLKCLTISGPAPSVENGLANLEIIRGMTTHMHREIVDISLTEVEHEDAADFALGMKPNCISAYPSFAARFSELIAQKAPGVARQNLCKDRSLRNFMLYLVTRVKKIRPKDLSKYKMGLFGGEPLDPYRSTLRRHFGLEAFEMYVFTEFMCPIIECRAHDGMHLWMDVCLPEIIPESDLERESQDPAYTPKAIPLWQAEPGLKGEYVLTTFAEALPLVRYRLGDLIKVVSNKPCSCGITHPRIKVPRRSDTTIRLGAIRFPVEQLEEKLLATTPYGKAQRWQLRIVREEYRPKLLIRVEPLGEIADRESFLNEISRKLMELKILEAGVKNRMVAEPVVLLAEGGLDEGRFATKAGRIIYEEDKQ